MKPGILESAPLYVVFVFIFFLILLFNWLGFRIKLRQLARDSDSKDEPGTIENSLLGLMALLLAFSFGMAASKFDERKKLIVEEANDIGTAILRCDLFPDSLRSSLRLDFREYVQARIRYYEAGMDTEKIQRSLDDASVISQRIWGKVVDAGKNKDSYLPCQLMIPATNDMIDIASTRENARINKVPLLILYMLLVLTLTSSFITGYNSHPKKRNIIMVLGFALMMALTLYLVLELNRPRKGLINLDSTESNITALLKMLE